MYIYIYIYIERERDIDMCIHVDYGCFIFVCWLFSVSCVC